MWVRGPQSGRKLSESWGQRPVSGSRGLERERLLGGETAGFISRLYLIRTTHIPEPRAQRVV